MFTCISKFFATLTSVFNSIHTISTVGEKYATLYAEEADHKLTIRRRELAAQIELTPAA